MSFFTVVGVLITSSCLTSSVRSAMATSVTPTASTEDEGEVIVIGGSQSSTENYISMPNTEEVPVSFSEYPVYAYDQNSNSDMHAEFWKTNKECPGGGHDCLYTEKVETIQKTRKLSDDNKVMMKMGEEWKEVEPNKQYTMEHGSGSSTWTQTIELPVGQYLLILMMLYKMTGKPKPRVVIDLPAKKRET